MTVEVANTDDELIQAAKVQLTNILQHTSAKGQTGIGTHISKGWAGRTQPGIRFDAQSLCHTVPSTPAVFSGVATPALSEGWDGESVRSYRSGVQTPQDVDICTPPLSAAAFSDHAHARASSEIRGQDENYEQNPQILTQPLERGYFDITVTRASIALETEESRPEPEVIGSERYDNPQSPQFVTPSASHLSPSYSPHTSTLTKSSDPQPLTVPEPLLLRLPRIQPLAESLSEHSSESTAEVHSSTQSTDNEKASRDLQEDKLSESWLQIIHGALERNWIITRTPAVVFPTPPTDEQKYHYLKGAFRTYFLFGAIARYSGLAGLWLFSFTVSYFSWFTPFVLWCSIYAAFQFVMPLFASQFKMETQQRVLRESGINLYDGENDPSVDVLLPCCGEDIEVLANTYKYVSKLQYPKGKMRIFVLDDGDDPSVRALAEKWGFTYWVRDNRPMLKKAGNLRWVGAIKVMFPSLIRTDSTNQFPNQAFARTQGEIFLVLDADFCPRHDMLLELSPWMKNDPDIAIVQTPQYFKGCFGQTWVEKGANAVQESFYRASMPSRNRWKAAMCVGTNAIYRRAALEAVGGTAAVPYSEDVNTSFQAILRGWKVFFLPLCLAAGVSPDTPRALFSQHIRWCTGSTQLFFKKELWRNDKMTIPQKMVYGSGFFYYTTSMSGIFLVPIACMLLVWFKVEYVKWWNVFFAVPGICFTVWSSQIWSTEKRDMCAAKAASVMSYAYLSALLDLAIGKKFTWAPSGNAKAHASARYRNIKIFAWAWTIFFWSVFLTGFAVQSFAGHRTAFYNFLPALILNLLSTLWSIPFLISS